MIDRLKFNSRHRHFGNRDCSAWSRLVQDFCFADTYSETEELIRFRKSVDDALEVRLRVCHKGTVISKQCVEDPSLERFSFAFNLPRSKKRGNKYVAKVYSSRNVR